ncbi:Serine/threonine protein kinase [Candidatus Sulfopaludibacter sp. SbA6]|nr:Serine/threonine protein kinase [Candidatus Sulfopaludibacter sp. SbA6]
MAAFDIPRPRRSASSGESSVEPAASPQPSGADTQAADSTITGDPDTSPLPLVSEPAPLRWGHLEHLEKIGRGEFGEVYRAWDVQLEREVALKLSRADRRFQASGSWGGLQEARLLARVRHPSVVTVYGADHCEGRFGVWMEYIRGRTLEALLKRKGTLAAREATLIGLDLCAAVAAVHGAGLLHRDIKTKNVMRERGGRIVLMDFGLSQDILSSSRAAREICGTPVYMAPELLWREQATVQSDIYSIGVLLYHLVTGCYPVEARNLAEVRQVHERGETIPLCDRRAGLPEPFLWTVDLALAPDPADRFAKVGQMFEALKASLDLS